MPGVLDSKSNIGFSREVGKMAFFMHPDLLNFGQYDASALEDLANTFLSNSTSPRDNTEGEELLPDESTVDLVKFLDNHEYDEGSDLTKSLLCDHDCTNCKKSNVKGKVSARDPFMGSATLNSLNRSSNESCSTPCWSILGQITNPLEDKQGHSHSPQQDTFNAWSHTSNPDEYQVFTKSSFFASYQDDECDDTFPDTPSTCSYSDHALTDDSDVDIETVTDAPRSVDLYPTSSSQDSSPLSSPSVSPTPIQNLQKGSLMTILSRSTSVNSGVPSSSNSKTLLRFSSQGVSSSASLAENLMLGRSSSISGQKRKLQKERKMAVKSSSHSSSLQAAYSHILVNSNSVNFHDYAMSPGSCMDSTETGRPTVMAKRIYKKRPIACSIDVSDKEKQHHHNQLERNRRQKLADLFTDLRDEIPKIKTHSKASKVVILNEATDHIRDLKRLEVHQENEIESQSQKQVHLKEQLRHLQSRRLLLGP